jgi:DNA polymerase IIIc chi subunit
VALQQEAQEQDSREKREVNRGTVPEVNPKWEQEGEPMVQAHRLLEVQERVPQPQAQEREARERWEASPRTVPEVSPKRGEQGEPMVRSHLLLEVQERVPRPQAREREVRERWEVVRGKAGVSEPLPVQALVPLWGQEPGWVGVQLRESVLGQLLWVK